MANIRVTDDDIRILAQVMQGEAKGQDPSGIGEELVGIVVGNRVIAGSVKPKECTDFAPYNTVAKVVFAPNAFESTKYPPFYGPISPETLQRAKEVSQGKTRWPASVALWFYNPKGKCPDKWYNQPFEGEFPKGKDNAHCFFKPKDICKEVYANQSSEWRMPMHWPYPNYMQKGNEAGWNSSYMPPNHVVQPSQTPQTQPEQVQSIKNTRFSDDALKINIGKKVTVIANYVGQNPINQNIKYIGVLKDIGTDYIIVTYNPAEQHHLGKNNGNNQPKDLFLYTVNIARLEFEELTNVAP